MRRILNVRVLGLASVSLALAVMTGVETSVLAASAAPSAELAPALAKPEFPRHAEVEFERSVIRIPVRFGGDTEPREIVELSAFMRLEREAPVRNTIGYRQFEFTIRDWELFGYSEALGAHISLAASKDVVQPKSLCVALQKDSDFPALIVYNAIYDIFIDGRKVVSQRPGVAMARGVVEIPPRNITVAFQKPFTVSRNDLALRLGLAEKTHGCADPDDPYCTIFDAGTCEDMTTVTREEFEAGLREAQAIREELATLKPKKAEKVAAP